jgi:hypothetical protein
MLWIAVVGVVVFIAGVLFVAYLSTRKVTVADPAY